MDESHKGQFIDRSQFLDKDEIHFRRANLAADPRTAEQDTSEIPELRRQVLEERRVAYEALHEAIREPLKDIAQYEALDSMARGEFSRGDFKDFAVERYLAAQPFERLLEAGMITARTAGDFQLSRVLQENLDDEQGIQAGHKVPDASHEKWRQDFYSAIGVTEEMLRINLPYPGTEAYIQEVEDLIATNDPVVIGGALLVLEASISEEFSQILKGVNAAFPELDAKALLYLKSHISHDAESHYPDLAAALASYVDETGALDPRLQRGIAIMRRAKRKFYDGVEKMILRPKTRP